MKYSVKIGYQNKYRLRIAIPGKKSIEVTFPYKVVDREARKRGLSVDAFLAKFDVIAEYDSFEGVVYKFVETHSGDRGNGIKETI